MIIDISKARDGMILDQNVYGQNNVAILTAGKELTEPIINSLIKHGIKTISIDYEPTLFTENQVNETISKEIKAQTIAALKELNIDKILKSSQDITGSILKSKEFSYDLAEYKNEPNIFNHSTRVAAFAAVLAKYYNQQIKIEYEPDKKKVINVNNLVTAALTHDLGKTINPDDFSISMGNIPDSFKQAFPGILNMPTNKFDERYKSVYTYSILRNFPIDTEIKLMALLTDENDLGIGPLKANSQFMARQQGYITASKIIRLCSFYDDILKLIIENNQSLENVSAMLETFGAKGILDKDLVTLFINHVPLYSKGIKVVLSDGRIAKIKQAFTEKLNNYKPIVEIISTNEIIDLREEINLTISQICSNEISYEELVARQLIDMSNEFSENEEKQSKTF